MYMDHSSKYYHIANMTKSAQKRIRNHKSILVLIQYIPIGINYNDYVIR